MFLTFADELDKLSPTAAIIISIALMLFVGFALTRITKLMKLPNVTAYILAGIIMGPYCFKLIPTSVISGMDFLPDIALAFIAFGTGEFFRLDVLKKNGSKTIVITLFESLIACLLVFILTFFILGLSFPFALVISSLASATAPASTMMTIRQTGAKGDFVNTLLQVVALDDIVCLVIYSISISVAKSSLSDASINAWDIIKPILLNLGVLALGGLFGFLLKILMPKRRSTDNKLIIGIATIFAFCGLCVFLDISPLLGCMSMGMVYINVSNDDKFFKQMNYFAPPILLLFFVRSGLNFKLDALFSSSMMGSVPLIVVGLLYFFVRIIGKYGGAFIGCATVKKDKKVRNYLGLALIPQAGVAIGLAAMGARTLGGSMGQELETIILASSVLYELIGPALAKLSLYLSKSYSNKLDDIVTVDMVDENGKLKSDVDLLIEKINKIQEQIPKHEEVSEEERAFTEASMEQYQQQNQQRMGFFRKWRRR
ncbi:MAG: cation:proton antiporter [Acholeplasmatales bacterium]|nr:cation:proton antiporter [Acholeplasmatales bacterium]